MRHVIARVASGHIKKHSVVRQIVSFRFRKSLFLTSSFLFISFSTLPSFSLLFDSRDTKREE